VTDYAAVLANHPDYAGRQWSIGNDYATLVMYDGGPKPMKKALEDKYPEVAAMLATQQVEEARRLRYQAETDGMFFAAQRDGTSLDAWKAAVEQIKADLPYPEAP
jgi:hypothetical protein